MNPNKIKCKSCSCMRTIDQYTYSNKINKSCVKCRDKRNTRRSTPVIYFISTKNPITKKINIYVGSTSQFKTRKSNHKSCIISTNNTNKLYTSIRNNGGNWKMVKLKDYPCDNKIDLVIEEYNHIIKLSADLNTNPSYEYLISNPNWENKKRENPHNFNIYKQPNEPSSYEQFIRHHKLFKKLNFEFLCRAAKPVHIYNMRTIFKEIRDLSCPISES